MFRRPRSCFLALAVAVASSMAAAPARAESTATSTISQLMVNEASNDKHRLFHGAVWLKVDKATANYRWGGKHCGGETLAPDNLRLLYEAFSGQHSVTLEYRVHAYKQKPYRCVTGFTITR